MKKIFTSLFCSALFATSFAQWSPASMQGEKIKTASNAKSLYSVDIDQIRNTLANAQETGKNSKPVIVSIPTLEGKIEKFAVYSFPVVVKSIADRYQLGSYVGVGLDDPRKYVRFSVSPNDFQSMMIKDGKYQFIEPQNKEKTVYGVHEKTINSGDKAFMCNTTEAAVSKEDLEKLMEAGNNFANQPTDFSKSSDRKYRTMRLAMSTTGEYTAYHGGLAGATAAINATMTRVNGVFENDFSLHLDLQDFPELIFTDAATDPYSIASVGTASSNSSTLLGWGLQLQNTLSTTIGSAAYDIGHVFGATGGGGNAGCIGCVCIAPTGITATNTNKGKGSAFTSPADGVPQGDNFDIDYVAHEMGHQLGDNHTFSHSPESGTGVSFEPGSGSTIMGYAGITGANTDVQPHSDPYFHIGSIIQTQNNLIAKTCDVETAIPNNPPVIEALPNITIPKSTAFVLSATVTDPENDPMTYTWEQVDVASTSISKTTLGNTTSGASFRSLLPSASPVRYFPRLSTVLAGNLKDVNNFEAVSTVARLTKFRITVRDNSASNPGFQQTQNALQNVTIGNDGPFAITSATIFNNSAGPFVWDVANTASAPYNATNVKIDYTTNNGATWTVIAASTPNDGSENLNFAPLATGTNAIVRISAIGNVFYAVKTVQVKQLQLCDGSAPNNLISSNVTINSARVSWDAFANATYTVRYRKVGATVWTSVNSINTFSTLSALEESTEYEVQVAAICTGTTGTYSPIIKFTTLSLTYCTVASGNSSFEHISNVTVAPAGGPVMSNDSGASTYTSYAAVPTNLINLVINTTANTITVTKKWASTTYNESVYAWIDFNRNGVYDTNELIMATTRDKLTPVTATFSVPADAYIGNQTVGMRVLMSDAAAVATPCASFAYGEVEDYSVKIAATLATGENVNKSESIQVYPNPAVDVLNVTKVSNSATYSIFNTAGQMVLKGKVTSNKVPVSKLEKGIYIISIDNNGETAKVKFIKK